MILNMKSEVIDKNDAQSFKLECLTNEFVSNENGMTVLDSDVVQTAQMSTNNAEVHLATIPTLSLEKLVHTDPMF